MPHSPWQSVQRLFKLPLFVWTLYGTAWIQLLATPVIGITLVLVALERVFGVGVFNPALGGDPVLYQHLFWIYSHPAVYIMGRFLKLYQHFLKNIFSVIKLLSHQPWPLLLSDGWYGDTTCLLPV